MAARIDPSVKPVIGAMRTMLYVASALVFIAGIQTYVLTDDTDRFFAWTIGIPLTTAFLGAGYFAAGALEILVARERAWADARTTVPAVWVFTTLTLVATLLHYDAFHMDTARGWAWLIVYAVVPVVLGVILLLQIRAPGTDPPRRRPMPAWVIAPLAVQSAGMGMAGIGLFLVPETFDQIWPWALTPLTARAIGAWLIGLAMVAGQMAAERDWRRVRVSIIGYLLWSILLLIALVRYPETPDWDSLQSWTFLGVVLSVAAVGGYGVYRSQGGNSIQPES